MTVLLNQITIKVFTGTKVWGKTYKFFKLMVCFHYFKFSLMPTSQPVKFIQSEVCHWWCHCQCIEGLDTMDKFMSDIMVPLLHIKTCTCSLNRCVLIIFY